VHLFLTTDQSNTYYYCNSNMHEKTGMNQGLNYSGTIHPALTANPSADEFGITQESYGRNHQHSAYINNQSRTPSSISLTTQQQPKRSYMQSQLKKSIDMCLNNSSIPNSSKVSSAKAKHSMIDKQCEQL